jgi:hypothetical protein
MSTKPDQAHFVDGVQEKTRNVAGEAKDNAA